MVAVVRVVGGVMFMSVVMKDRFSNRLQDTIPMRRRGEMDGNVIEIEGEPTGNEESNPPPRRFRREATSVLLARVHKDLA